MGIEDRSVSGPKETQIYDDKKGETEKLLSPGGKGTKKFHSHESPACFGNHRGPGCPPASARQPGEKAGFE